MAGVMFTGRLMKYFTFLLLLFPMLSFGIEIKVINNKDGKLSTGQCSRSSPQEIESYWQIDSESLLLLKQNMHKVNTVKSRACCNNTKIENHDNYNYQATGIVINGKKVIYINAFHKSTNSHFFDRDDLITVCDGGNYFWGVEFHMQEKVFKNLAVNGGA